MKLPRIVPVLFLISTISCSGGSRPQSVPNVAGAYEFVVISNVTGGVTLVDANLAANGNQSSASGPSQVQVLSLEHKVWYVDGVCPGSTPGQNSMTAVSNGNNLSLNFNEGGNAFAGQGIVTGTTINANYSISGSTCPDLQGIVGFPPGTDSGGIVGNQVPDLSGTFVGTLNLPSGNDNASLTLTENSDHTLSVNAVLTGSVDNGTFLLTGNAVGNIMFVSGPVNGSMLSLFGYFDRAGVYTKMPNSLLVFNYDTSSNAGLLLGQ